jgi:hypothetical protein
MLWDWVAADVQESGIELEMRKEAQRGQGRRRTQNALKNPSRS